MTKEDFENQLLEDLLTGKVEEYVYDYIEDNLSILKEYKDYFRQYFLNNPIYAYCYALDIDECFREDTRQAACKAPHYSYCYALDIDKCPRDDTRLAACKDPIYAYKYAYWVDKCSRDDTRQAACKSSEDAYYYARYVDKCFNEVTFNAVKGTKYEELYLRDVKSILKKVIDNPK